MDYILGQRCGLQIGAIRDYKLGQLWRLQIGAKK